MSFKSRFVQSLSCVVTPLLLMSSALGQEIPRFEPLPVAFRDVPELLARIGDGSTWGEGGIADCTPSIVTWSSANFGGGPLIVQAGFSETEIAAVSFTVPADQFPVRIDLAEIIFATSAATVATTTEWSVLFWEGTPATGQLVAVFSSDDKILPHIQLPPGTAGVNLNFLVDPGDPEQIILQNNGSNRISVGFRVDKHNNQTANPCFTAPPSASNAFPTTDTNGLGSSSNNWIYALNCIVCPGGWSSFAQLPTICRPSGDWNIRLSYTGLGCAPPTPGACCLPNGTCNVMDPGSCASLGGTFIGPGQTCVGVTCVPTGNVPCCFQSTGGCVVLSYSNCQLAGGVPGPVGVSCASHVCFPTGACCKIDGTCSVMSPTDCSAIGGLYQGNSTTCAQVNCPAPTGAACFPNDFCLILSEADAIAVGAEWRGAGTTCADLDGSGIADQCESAPPCRQGDFNCDGRVDGSDLGELLGFWGPCLAPCPAADLNQDGRVDGNDLGSLLGLWG